MVQVTINETTVLTILYSILLALYLIELLVIRSKLERLARMYLELRGMVRRRRRR